MPLEPTRDPLQVGHSIDPTQLAFDEGPMAFVLLAIALALASMVPAILRRILVERAAEGDEGGSTARASAVDDRRLGKSVEASSLPRGSRPAPAPPSRRPREGRGSSVPTGGAAAETAATGSVDVRRCPRCYGKFDAAREPDCPHCRESEAAREELSGGFPQVELEDVPARTRFHEAERLNAEGVEVLQNMRSTFRLDDAVKSFGRAIELAPRNAIYHSNRGIAHLTNANRRLQVAGDRGDALFLRDLEQAREDVRNAVELRPRHANFHFLLGQVEELAGELDSARSAFARAQELDAAHLGAGDALVRIERSIEEGSPEVRREKAKHIFDVAQEFLREENLDVALSTMEDASRADPDWPVPLLARAELLERLGRGEESLQLAKQAVEVSGKDVEQLLEAVHAQGIRLSSAAGADAARELSVAPRAPRREGGLSGSLEELGLPDLLQVLGNGEKTLRLEVDRGSRKGCIDLDGGAIVHAEQGELSGEDALFELVTWAEGHFRVDPSHQPVERTIDGSNESLILEGLRRLDERLAASDGADAGPS